MSTSQEPTTTVCDRCAMVMPADHGLTGPGGETLCDTCACEVADEQAEDEDDH